MDVEDSKETAASTADTSSSATIQLVSYGIKYIYIKSVIVSFVVRPFQLLLQYEREKERYHCIVVNILPSTLFVLFAIH